MKHELCECVFGLRARPATAYPVVTSTLLYRYTYNNMKASNYISITTTGMRLLITATTYNYPNDTTIRICTRILRDDHDYSL